MGANNFESEAIGLSWSIGFRYDLYPICRVFSTICFHIPHKSTFYKFQKGSTQNIVWCDVALRVWDNHKWQLQNEVRAIGQPILAYVDIRYDSSRFAYHGIILIIHVESGKVIELVTKTRVDGVLLWILEDVGTEEVFRSLNEGGLVKLVKLSMMTNYQWIQFYNNKGL